MNGYISVNDKANEGQYGNNDMKTTDTIVCIHDDACNADMTKELQTLATTILEVYKRMDNSGNERRFSLDDGKFDA